MRTFILTLILATVGGTAIGQETKLPDHAAAIVHGDVISMVTFRDVLIRRYASTQQGQNVLGNLVTDILVNAEARKRGISVSDAEVETEIEKTTADLKRRSGGKMTLDDLLKERQVSREDFLEISRGYLLRQRMAAQDLDVAGKVSGARLGVWIEDLKRKGGVEYEGLPEGIYARVGGRPITGKVFGDALIKQLSPDRLETTLWDLAIALAVKQKLAGWEVEITESDLTAALRELEREFRADPRFANLKVDFAQWVQSVRNLSIEELKKDPGFLAQVGLTKKLRLDLTEAEVKDYYTKNQDRYGERRKFIHLLVKGEDKATPFGKGSRSLPEAKDIIRKLLEKQRAGASFEELVKRHSEARTATIRPEDPITVTRVSTLPPALRDIVFGAAVGDIHGPIRTSYGYHLVKVIEVIKAPGYQKSRDKVEDDLLRTKRRNALLSIRQDEGIVRRY